jgi:hypothetical protein
MRFGNEPLWLCQAKDFPHISGFTRACTVLSDPSSLVNGCEAYHLSMEQTASRAIQSTLAPWRIRESRVLAQFGDREVRSPHEVCILGSKICGPLRFNLGLAEPLSAESLPHSAALLKLYRMWGIPDFSSARNPLIARLPRSVWGGMFRGLVPDKATAPCGARKRTPSRRSTKGIRE